MAFRYSSKQKSKKGDIVIIPYGGYADKYKIFGTARVLEDMGIQHSEEDKLSTNLWNTYRRFETDEISGARILAKWEKGETELQSDKEGYTYLRKKHNLELDHQEIKWLPLEYNLLDEKKSIFKIKTEVMKPGKASQFGVITDIDDTLLVTGVSSTFKWKMVVNSAMVSSSRRQHFPKADKLYHTLNKNGKSKAVNPIFYLSNSPWNMYDYLISFLKHKKFPKGTVILRDYGPENRQKKTWKESNKYLRAREIVTTYSKLPFILIGDAGEKDAKIYAELANEFGSRIKHIFIREVNKQSANNRVKRLIDKLDNVPMKLFKHSDEVLDVLRMGDQFNVNEFLSSRGNRGLS